MPVTPLQARCRSCLGDFFLFEIVDRQSTTCPRCGQILTDSDYVFLDAARRADLAQRLLIKELGRIHAAQGVLSVRPSTLLRNVFEGLNWERPFRERPALANEELAQLDKYRARWRGYGRDGSESVSKVRRRRPLRRRARREVTTEPAEDTATITSLTERIAEQRAAKDRIEQSEHAAAAQPVRTNNSINGR